MKSWNTSWNYKGISFYVDGKLISFVKWPSLWQIIKYKLESLLVKEGK